MTGSAPGRRGGLTAFAAAAVLFATGCTATDDAGTTAAPATAASSVSVTASPTATPPVTPPVTGTTAEAVPNAGPRGTDVAEPTSLSIPATGTRSGLLHLGLRNDGSLEVPPEGPGSPASWYTGSPAPGERGPAVLLGHVNATGGGPGVFAGLRQLVPGDRIEVAREDGTTAAFVVDRAEQYVKDDFPTLEVYGNTDGAELRLITCDGYDPATGEFEDNYVVYAVLNS